MTVTVSVTAYRLRFRRHSYGHIRHPSTISECDWANGRCQSWSSPSPNSNSEKICFAFDGRDWMPKTASKFTNKSTLCAPSDDDLVQFSVIIDTVVHFYPFFTARHVDVTVRRAREMESECGRRENWAIIGISSENAFIAVTFSRIKFGFYH